MIESQCTFWCSVLSDAYSAQRQVDLQWGLNAPFGAQCFPTWYNSKSMEVFQQVSMHLLVLSAFRLDSFIWIVPPSGSQCTFWCSVLSDGNDRDRRDARHARLNAPFGAQCFPTNSPSTRERNRALVSMHLLVLSAFRPDYTGVTVQQLRSQCTFWCSVLSDETERSSITGSVRVSMHLLVLSAFRPKTIGK